MPQALYILQANEGLRLGPDPYMSSNQPSWLTFHVELSADEVLDISHQGSDLGSVVGVVGEMTPDELLLSGRLVEQHQVHSLGTLWLDGHAHLHSRQQ